ncbi:hypothetical protein ACKI10_17225 [Streptomyces galilaeus]|uniref:Uncharacterized protein n=1 Tax=Streptomyces galilaeus TaxID=33899 RepID=A0ABW9INZ6_STRGJ
MAELWMPGATRYPLGNTGAMYGGPARAVWHITSNATDWTFKNELGWFKGGGAAVAPHLLWDPFTGEIAQFFPADSRSLSLSNDGSVKTNRTGEYCIQVEVVFTAGEIVGGKRYNTVRDTPCKGLDQIMAWLRSLGIDDRWPGGAPIGFIRDTVSAVMWQDEGGHYGHNQVRGNNHVDPGPMPDLFASPAIEPTTPTPEESDMPTVLDESNAIDVDLVSGAWTPLAFEDEGALLAGPIPALSVTAHLYFDVATSPDTKVQGVFFLTNLDGTGASNYLVVDKRGGGGHQFTHSLPVPAGKRLWFQVRAISPDGKPVRLLHRVASGLHWAA